MSQPAVILSDMCAVAGGLLVIWAAAVLMVVCSALLLGWTTRGR